jgi:hypothetical protein
MTAGEAQQRLQDAFDLARQSASAQLAEREYVIGGVRTRFRIVGRTLARSLDEAFFHLQAAPECSEDPDLCVDVWDVSATGVPNPVATRCDGDVARVVDDGMFTTSDEDRYVVFERGEALTWLDRRSRRLLACRGGAESLPLIERAKPFTPLLSICLRDRDVHTVHAALVATERGGALVAGGSGVGKSTCALVCLEAGFSYLGDDYVAFELARNGGVTGYSLYASSRICQDRPERLPSFALDAIPGRPPAEAKALLLLKHVPGAELLGSAPLRVLLLPRVAGISTTRVRRAGKAEAFRALIASSFLIRVPSLDRRGVEVLSALVDRVPAYHLDLGDDLKEIPVRVRDVLDEARG